jgi:hypothetical protein
VTESSASSRLIYAVRTMADSSYFREKAEQALRLARGTTDPMLVKSLMEMAQEYLAQADAINGTKLGEDSEDE